MAYIKNNWVDREGTTRYFETVDSDGAKIFTPDYTQVTELGTPVNADNMNHIEEGIAAGSFTKFDLNATYAKDDLVTVIEEASPVIYKSLVDNNIGNALSSSIAWEKISLGGGGGLEIGDIGIAPLGIDETKGKRRYLNGQLIIQEQYVQFTNKVKSAVALYPSLACTESEWQTTATMTVGGQVGKFVVDDNAGTIRLPKIIMPIQGLTDLSKLGEIVEAGLPNITGRVNSVNGGSSSAGTGAIVKTTSSRTGQHDGGSENQWMTLEIDASLSNSIYGNSGTVQQEQIQYPYFIQVATGSETEDNIINAIELNNPYSFGDSKYSPVALNNLSWLKSDGQWNFKAVYPAYYDWALTNFNNGVKGFALSTGEYTDYDVVINTADETFRLPLLDGSENIVDYSSQQVIATNFVAPCRGLVFAINKSLSSSSGSSASRLYVNSVQVGTASGGSVVQDQTSMYAFVKKGDVVTFTNMLSVSLFKSTGNGSLYFYIGETVQNANLINAGRIQEKVAECLTRSNKNEITSWVCPDWSNAIAYANNTTVNTAPANGYVVINYNYQGEGGMFKINGTIVGSATGNNSYRGILNGMYVVNKGDTFQLAKTSSTGTSDTYTPLVYKFVPMKGAN